ncbi:MAG: hypothetical protein V3R99_13880, partial [Thermoguttaceae bacterium]
MADDKVTRRDFVRTGAAAGLAAGVRASAASASEAEDTATQQDQETRANGMPYGRIGELKISRLIFGSNTPGAHSRDLIYVSALGRAYNTLARMLDTYELAESLGINTLLQGNSGPIREYNSTRGGNLRIIQPVNVGANDDKEKIKKTLTGAMKNDVAAAFYIWGDQGDYLAMARRMDQVGVAMEVAKQLGMVLGLGGHSLEVPIQCDGLGIKPDFYVKTFHHDNYWSATPKENREPFCWYDDAGGNSYSGQTGEHDRFHDNIWCLDPEKTIEVMRRVDVPWIAFKVLAAGAIYPRQGFRYAFHNGADFIAVGMLDFQLRENVALVKR